MAAKVPDRSQYSIVGRSVPDADLSSEGSNDGPGARPPSQEAKSCLSWKLLFICVLAALALAGASARRASRPSPSSSASQAKSAHAARTIAGSNATRAASPPPARVPPPADCQNLGPAPYYDHSYFPLDKKFESEYPLNTEEMVSLLPLKYRYPLFEAFLGRLASGTQVRIATIGGSFTEGHECEQHALGGKGCSWLSRVIHWQEKTFPHANATYHFFNRGGTASCPHSSMLPLMLQEVMKDGPLDLMIFDTLVNGLFESHQDRFCYELLIRTLHDLSPSTAVFSVLAAPPGRMKDKQVYDNMIEEERVLEYYQVPYVNLAKLAVDRPALWTKEHVHPLWETHQYLADMVGSVWGRIWAGFCGSEAPAANPGQLMWPEASYFPAQILAKYQPCLHPLYSYSAFDFMKGVEVGHPQPVVHHGNWALQEDRPGKPGWIATEVGSNMSFRVAFGEKPNLMLVYLRSYKGLGRATVHLWMDKQQAWDDHVAQQGIFELTGQWEQRVSQSDIFRVVERFQPAFTINPFQSGSVSVTLRSEKFKIIGIYSC